MTIEELLAQILGGGQHPVNRMAGNWNGPDAEPNRLVAPRAGPSAAMAPQGAPMPVQQQGSPVAAPQPSGGGILSRLFGGGASDDENYTVNWLTQQGMDPGTATMMAKHKPSLQAYLLERAGMSGGSDAGFSLSPGEQRYDAQGNLIATGPAKGKKRDLTPEEVAARGYPAGSYQLDEGTGDVTTVGGAREQDPTFGRELDLRKEYEGNKIVQTYQVVRDNFERIREGAQLGSGPGDMAVVYGYMKTLDPGSVVMEGERATAENAGGVPAKVRNTYNKLMEGDILPPELRAQYIESAAKIYKSSAANLGDFNKRYSDVATQYKLDPLRIIQQPEEYGSIALSSGDGPSLDEWREVAPGVKIRPKAN